MIAWQSDPTPLVPEWPCEHESTQGGECTECGEVVLRLAPTPLIACPGYSGQWFDMSSGYCTCGGRHSLLDVKEV